MSAKRVFQALALLLTAGCQAGGGSAPAAEKTAERLLIAGFETKEEFFRWEKLRLPVQKAHQVMEMTLTGKGATEGKQALKIHQPLEKQRISWGLAEGLPRDWSTWKEIAFDVTYAGEGPGNTVGVSLIVDDWRSTGEWKDVFHNGFRIRKGTQTCRVSIHQIATRVDVRRIRQITFTHSGNGPATWYVDNVRLEGRRAEPFKQKTPGFRVHMGEADRLHPVIGDDFRRFQIVSDGYYEPKGWMPSREFIARMDGLAFTEYSERKGSYEQSQIVLRLKRDVPKFHAARGMKIPAGSFDPKALPREAGSIEFWVRPETDTIEQTGARTFLHAVKDLENQVKGGFLDGDLFFEIRSGGERHIVRHWDQTIWGDIRKAPARWQAGERHHVRVTWGPDGMYLNVDDEEIPYNLFMLHRKPEDEPEPTPYKGALPEGLESMAVGSNVDGTGRAEILDGEVFVTKDGKRGPRWGDLPFVRKGVYESEFITRGRRYSEPAFRMQKFMATAKVPEGTSVKWEIAGFESKPTGFKTGRTPFETIRPGDDVPARLGRYDAVVVRATVEGDGRSTPEIDEWHIVQFNPPHPRLFIDAKQLEKIRERIKAKPLKTLYEKLVALKPENRGHLHNAFLYHVTGDEKYKAEAIADFKAAQASKRKPREHWDIIGCEWMLGFLEGEERAGMLKHVAGLMDRGIPRDNIYWNQSMNGWRHAMHRGMMSNIAMAGEEGPWIHDARHSLRSYEDFLKAWMIPAFNQVGGVWPEGFGYHSYTGEGPVLSIEGWRTYTGENLWPTAAPFFRNLGAWYAYSRQPHTGAVVHVNDDSGRTRWLIWSWTHILSGVFKDPYLQADAGKIIGAMTRTRFWRTREGIKLNPGDKRVTGYFDLLQPLLWHDPEVAAVDYVKEPRARCLRGMDWITTRGDWSKDATFVTFIPYDWYGGHKQADTGSFTVSKAGELVDDPMDSRRFASEQHFGYRMRSAAHNVLYAGEPDVLRLGDGGQLRNGMPMPGDVIPDSRFDTADLLAFRDTKHYTWMSADLGGAYRVDRAGGVLRVQKYVRSILFLRPDVVVVHDRVLPTDAESRLAFVLHNSAGEPEVTGQAEKLSDDVTRYDDSKLATLSAGRGRLFCRALLPADALTVKRRVPGTHKGAPVERATVWQLEYEPPDKPAGGHWLDFLVVMRATVGEEAGAPECKMLSGGKGTVAFEVKADGDTWDITLGTGPGAAGQVRLTRDGKAVMRDRLEGKTAAAAAAAGR